MNLVIRNWKEIKSSNNIDQNEKSNNYSKEYDEINSILKYIGWEELLNFQSCNENNNQTQSSEQHNDNDGMTLSENSQSNDNIQ